jgi:hypothetical protein
VAVTTSTAASAFKVPFANTTVSTTGNYGLLQDSEATFTYNPSTNTLVAGTFSGAFSGALSGNATTATTLQTTRAINGVNFNGSAAVTIPANVTDRTTNESGHLIFIGTTATGNQSVYSNTNFRINPSTNTLTVTNLSATSITETSSIAYKENVSPIDSALDKVLQLMGVTYDRKDGSSKNEAGLIAEDVAKVLPNIVSEKEGKPEGIQYTKLTAYLIECIKELNAKIERLEGKS